MSGQVFVGNRTVFRYTVQDQDGDAVDLSNATTKQIVLQSPHGVRYSYTATFETDGTDGVMEYRVTMPTPAGVWKGQVYLAGVAGFTGYSTMDVFAVLNPL